jgi:hypothetical protein
VIIFSNPKLQRLLVPSCLCFFEALLFPNCTKNLHLLIFLSFLYSSLHSQPSLPHCCPQLILSHRFLILPAEPNILASPQMTTLTRHGVVLLSNTKLIFGMVTESTQSLPYFPSHATCTHPTNVLQFALFYSTARSISILSPPLLKATPLYPTQLCLCPNTAHKQPTLRLYH